MSLMIKVLDQWQELEKLRPELDAVRQDHHGLLMRYTALMTGLRQLIGDAPASPYSSLQSFLGAQQAMQPGSTFLGGRPPQHYDDPLGLSWLFN